MREKTSEKDKETLSCPPGAPVKIRSGPAGAWVGGKETILLVDDEAVIAEITKEILEMLGYRTLLAGSGQEAISVFTEKHAAINLVILDMVMPGMSGAKVFEALRSLKPDIKIIVYSGYFINDEIQSLLDRGGCEFIQKPFSIEALSEKIREMMDPSLKGGGDIR